MGFKDECGVFGIFNSDEASALCYAGLFALQHRGQESCGIVSYGHKNFYVVKDMGLVSEVFNHENLHYLKGRHAIGHVRYSTTGESNINNVQPLYSKTSNGKIAIAHNGNLTNAYAIHNRLEEEGALFQSTVDSEIILHLISRASDKSIIAQVQSAFKQLEGAFSVVLMGENYLMAVRDPNGFRPLVLGKLGSGYVVASETCAFDLIGATYIREVEPGEIIYISDAGLVSDFIPKKITPSYCIFEHVYFARPDSLVYGENVHLVRKAFGQRLAQEHPVDADIVIAIPDSGNSAALGFAQESGIPFEMGITRNHYVGRTFIQPQQKMRDFSVKIKLNPIKATLKGKRVVVIDDSLVRGTTSRQRVKAIRDAGALEVHVRISSPPVKGTCHYGIDTPSPNKLIANKKSIDEIRDYINADSLGYLSIPGMLSCIKAYSPGSYCDACFSGKYPVKVQHKGKNKFKRRINLYAEKK